MGRFELMARRIGGCALIVVGFAAFIYFGLWLCFVGGIVTFIDGAKADPTSGSLIVWGLVKFFILTPVAWYFATRYIIKWGLDINDPDAPHSRY